MRVLGIETSCDETSAAVVEDGQRILANVVASQTELHQPYHGVVPEIACRAHLTDLMPAVLAALSQSGLSADDIDAVAVTYTPGLIGALLIGLTTAKTLAWLLDKPLIGVDHVEAHIYAAALGRAASPFPGVGLVVSGGHTTLFDSRDPLTHTMLGATTDDAAGEAFDKVAAILELPYPGGPSIDKAARAGNPRAIAFPRTFLPAPSLDFSFSGLKTAVLYHVRGQNPQQPAPPLSESQRNDVAASFQEAVVDVLVERAFAAVARTHAKRLIVGGGVSANSRLRARLQAEGVHAGVEVILPSLGLCVDNGAMVAGLAYHRLQRFGPDALDLDARARGLASRAAPNGDNV